MLTAAEIADMRAVSADALPDTCEITSADIDPSFDPVTGDYTPDPASVIYTGACRVRGRGTDEQPVDSGDRHQVLGDYTATLPHTADVQVDQYLTVTASTDTGMIGRAFRIVHVSWSSWQIDRRVGLEDQQHPVGASE